MNKEEQILVSIVLSLAGLLCFILAFKFSISTLLFYLLGWLFFVIASLIIVYKRNVLDLIPLVIFGISLRIIPYLSSSLIPFNDPWHELALVRFYLEQGFFATPQFDSYFLSLYSVTPLLHIVMGIISIVTGLNLVSVSILMMVILNVICLIFIYLISKIYCKEYIFIPSILFIILPDFLQWTMQTVRTFFAITLLLVLIYFLISQKQTLKIMVLEFIISALIVMSHHLTSLILVLVLIGFAISKKNRLLLVLTLFSISFLLLYWSFLSGGSMVDYISLALSSISSNPEDFVLGWSKSAINADVPALLLVLNFLRLALIYIGPLILICWIILKQKKVNLDDFESMYIMIFLLSLGAFILPKLFGEFNRMVLYLAIPSIFLFPNILSKVKERFNQRAALVLIIFIILLTVLFLWNKTFISWYIFDPSMDPDYENGEMPIMHDPSEMLLANWIALETSQGSVIFSDSYVQGVIVEESLRDTFHLTGEVFGGTSERGITLVKDQILEPINLSTYGVSYNYFVITTRMADITHLRTINGFLYLVNSSMDFTSLNKVYSSGEAEIYYGG